MKEISITARLAFAATAMTIFLGACAVAPPSASNKDIAAFTHRRLVKFRDMSEFEEYRDQVHRAAKARRVRWSQLSSGAPSALLAQNDSDPCDPSEEECDALQEIAVTGFRASSSSSITNNQEKDVDEGDIVKLYDRFLIVLQDGRLFSLDTGLQPGALRVVDRINVYPSAESETWYDELLIDENRLIVTGYNYEEGGTEINVISIGAAGELTLQARYFIESEDYYSGDNYASRLVHGNFVVYTPVDIAVLGDIHIPRIRSWTPASGQSEWSPLFDITDIYRPVQETLTPTLHVVSVCSLSVEQGFSCKSRGVVGPRRSERYVSAENVYLWIASDNEASAQGRWSLPDCPEDADLTDHTLRAATVFQMPIASQSVRALEATGTPHNQFAFDERDGHLLALLVREQADCELIDRQPLMYASIALSSFRTSINTLDKRKYVQLPDMAGELQNQFSSKYLVYAGSRAYWEDEAPASTDVVVVPIWDPAKPQRLHASHDIDRIELFGDHAVIVGSSGETDLGLSTIDLGRTPHIADSLVMPDLMQTETRSHGFNSVVDEGGSGLFGLPTMYRSKYEASEEEIPSDVQFYHGDTDLQISALGELSGENDARNDYTCEVSCIDWYGNARPIFIHDRIFALTGSELIEGRRDAHSITEIGRIRITGDPVRQH